MKYTLRRKILVLLGKEFTILDESGKVVAYAKQKAFKLREEIHVYADASMQTPLLSMKARNILDFGATFDIVDVVTGQSLGALRRLGLRSMFRDEWRILTSGDAEIGVIQEESGILAILRRFFSNLIPQNFDVRIGDQDAGQFKQQFNLFRYVLDFEVNEQLLDRRIAFAAAVLLGAIEGRQE